MRERMMGAVGGIVVGTVLAVAGLAAGEAPVYRITDLGGVGDSAVRPYAVNDHGQVVGAAGSAPFLWENGVRSVVDVPLPSGYYGGGLGINNAAQVLVGTTNSAGDTVGWLWDHGVSTQVGGSGGRVQGLNDSGQVVGYAVNGTGQEAFVWTAAGGMAFLGKEGAPDSYGDGINNLGQAVFHLASGRSFLWQGGTATEILPALGWTDEINNAGMILLHGSYAWLKNGATATHVPIDACYGLNDAGQVVGKDSQWDPSGQARLWTGQSAYGLKSLLADPAGWTSLDEAYDINNLGQIVGVGITAQGQLHGFLMTPIPEPATLSLLAVGGLTVWRKRRK